MPGPTKLPDFSSENLLGLCKTKKAASIFPLGKLMKPFKNSGPNLTLPKLL
jgi:hypothetical protein